MTAILSRPRFVKVDWFVVPYTMTIMVREIRFNVILGCLIANYMNVIIYNIGDPVHQRIYAPPNHKELITFGELTLLRPTSSRKNVT